MTADDRTPNPSAAPVSLPSLDLRRCVAALALELPGEVWDDVNAKVEAVLAERDRSTRRVPPLVSLCVVVHGAAYERYAQDLIADVCAYFLPGEAEALILPGKTGGTLGGEAWSYTSATRARVILEHLHAIDGEWVFCIDADMRILRPVGREILADGITVTTHPGFPPGDPNHYPYERDPRSSAYVPQGEGVTYHPGAFWGGRRDAFVAFASELADRVDADIRAGVSAVWYEESHLNRLLIDTPPALVLDARYCGWQDQTVTEETIIVHLNKTAEEFATRG